MSKCVNCDWYEKQMGDLCNYCYKKSKVLTGPNEIAEVCRKCDKGYKYTQEEVDDGDIGEDKCRECVHRRRALGRINFSQDELRDLLKQFHC